MTRRITSFCLLLLVTCIACMSARAAVDDHLVYSGRAGDYFHLQGQCHFGTADLPPIPTLCNDKYKPQNHTNLCESTWSCPGGGVDMIKATYANGLTVCAYINNSGKNNYFVPLNTAEEWAHFSDPNITPPDVRIVYGCPSVTKINKCGFAYTLPDAPVSDEIASVETEGGVTVQYICPSSVTVRDPVSGLGNAQTVRNCGDWRIVRELGDCDDTNGVGGRTFNSATPQHP